MYSNLKSNKDNCLMNTGYCVFSRNA